MTLSRAESISKIEKRNENAQLWKRMMAERIQNEKQEEEEYWGNPLREEKEAAARRERSMKKIFGSIEEKRKKMEEQAKKIQDKMKEKVENGEYMTPIERAMAETKKILNQRKLEERQRENSSLAETSKPIPKSTEPDMGRPRLPGDRDVAIGEIDEKIIMESSDVTTGLVRVEIRSSYSESKSIAEQRRHCFLYSIKITNLASTDSIQLMSRKFEIQTVGSSRKDTVEGNGVTGKKPILKPGEIYKYTSTAPLSVRPLGTTTVAARMSGSYKYKILKNGEDQDSETNEEEFKTAKLGQFHFVFPPSQRVIRLRSFDEEDDGDEDDDEDL